MLYTSCRLGHICGFSKSPKTVFAKHVMANCESFAAINFKKMIKVVSLPLKKSCKKIHLKDEKSRMVENYEFIYSKPSLFHLVWN